ncbi:UpxY family transcription antiterminator [uncultured Draconibacterium sp.]|uniref:UpxY family transcription antiterminator n=1 Tax=uncultured Draconibacterium sp. TaxID=1573823 RepID=UPI002AA7581B|nr:UpxY family transcription antiterminator [uncultured Draconibacterium sp.]
MPERIINMGEGVPSHQAKNDFMRRAWHVFYLRPRNERIASRLISNHGYEVFCPEVQKIKRWKNRQRKKVSLPLFPNYLFVYTYPHELFAIRNFSQVVNFVSFAGKPSIISEKEIHGIRLMLNVGVAITVETQFSSGEHVRIVSGPLTGHEGILIKRRNKSRFGIRLKAINHAVFIDIGQSDLEKL